MSRFKKLTFLKVMTAVAWADGEMTHSELNLLKSFIRKFDLEKNELEELKPYLSAPVEKAHEEELIRQLVAEISSAEEKQEILNALESMAVSPKRKSGEERKLVEQFRSWLEKSSPTARTLGKIRNFFKRTIFSHTREKDPDLEKYFKRKVLRKIELKARKQGHKITLSEDELYLICLLGTLLASVANVDGHFDESEKKSLNKNLAGKFSFRPEEWDVLFSIIEEQARQGFDFHEVITQVNELIPYRDRLNLIDGFFAIAVADGKISHEESEQIRKITKAMFIPHQSFKEAKVRALEQIK